MIDYISIQGLKLICLCKRAPGCLNFKFSMFQTHDVIDVDNVDVPPGAQLVDLGVTIERDNRPEGKTQ